MCFDGQESGLRCLGITGVGPAAQQLKFGTQVVTPQRYDRMRAAARQKFGLTETQSQQLYLYWRQTGEAFGERKSVVLVVGTVYHDTQPNAAAVVHYCREYVESEIASGQPLSTPVDPGGG